MFIGNVLYKIVISGYLKMRCLRLIWTPRDLKLSAIRQFIPALHIIYVSANVAWAVLYQPWWLVYNISLIKILNLKTNYKNPSMTPVKHNQFYCRLWVLFFFFSFLLSKAWGNSEPSKNKPKRPSLL